MKLTRRGGVFLLALAGLFGCGAAWGQTNGSIRGIVNDPSGAVVPGATITAMLTGTDSQRSVTSDKDGAFDIPELAVGTYERDRGRARIQEVRRQRRRGDASATSISSPLRCRSAGQTTPSPSRRMPCRWRPPARSLAR